MSNSTKVSSPIRSVFVKQWEGTRKNGNSPRTPPIVVVETSSPIPFNSKKNNNKPQPIIICERITNHNRPTPPPINPKTPLIKTWSQLKLMSRQQQQQIQTIESDTDSAIHTMPAVINNDMNDSTVLSRSNTTDSTCSSSSSSVSPAMPHFALPTIASTQKQRDLTTNTTTFKRICSPPPLPVTTFTRQISSTASETNENSESLLPLRSCASEINLVDQSRRLSSPDVSRSDTNLSRNSTTQVSINTNLPLKYKRDSFLRLYG
jgi:hypothetical protein